MEPINYYEVMPKKYLKEGNKVTYDDYDKIKIPLPCRIMVDGMSGSGKTIWMMNFFDNTLGAFDKYYVFTAEPHQSIYQYMRDRLKDAAKELNVPDRDVFEMHKTLNNFPVAKDFQRGTSSLVIVDDFMTDTKNLKKVENLFIKGRHRNVSILWLTQSFYETPKTMRGQLTHIVIKTVNDEADLKSILSHYHSRFDKKEVMNKYNKVQESDNPASFLLLDLQTNDPDLKCRLNWNNKI